MNRLFSIISVVFCVLAIIVAIPFMIIAVVCGTLSDTTEKEVS